MQPAVEGFWDEQKHPRGQGGRFGAGAYTSATGNTNLKRYSTGSGISTTVPGGGGKGGKGAAKKPAPGPLSFNPKTNTGTGYGTPHGDPRVRSLQTVLNRLHITDKAGAQLIIDGKLGPLTTTAVKKLQAALGVAQNGVVTPALLTRLQHMKQLPKPKPAKKVKVAKAAKPPAPPKPRPAPRPRARRTYHGYSALDRLGVDSPAVARLAEAHPVPDSPALQRWLEEWDAARHPRGPGGRFISHASAGITSKARKTKRASKAAGNVADKVAPTPHTHESILAHAHTMSDADLAKLHAAITEIHHGRQAKSSALGHAAKSVDVKSRIRSEMQQLQREPGDWVSIADLRDRLGDVSQAQFDAAVKEMVMHDQNLNLIPEADQTSLRQRDHEAAIWLGGEYKHLISM